MPVPGGAGGESLPSFNFTRWENCTPLLLPSSCTAVNPQVGVKGDVEFIILTTSVMSDLDIFENLME